MVRVGKGSSALLFMITLLFRHMSARPTCARNHSQCSKTTTLRSGLGLALTLILGFCFTQITQAQVTHLATTSGLSTTTAAVTVSHTTSVASNRIMLVGISHTKDDPTINSVTYGGVALTALGTAQTSDFRSRIYLLNAPAAGTADVVVTFSANVSKGAIATVSTYSGVNQTTALGTLAAASGDSDAPSLAVASASGDLVHDVLTTETGSGTITLGAGQTPNGAAPADVGIVRNRSSRETAAGTSTTMSYTMTQKKWSSSGVAIKSAPPSPVISVSGTLAAVNTVFGSASPSPSSFTVSGTNMTAGITVAPPTGFQVSTVLGSGYANSIVVGSSGTIVPTTIFVRLAASTAVGNYSGNITVSSTGATNQTIATASSAVSKAAATVTTAPTASSITFGQTLASSTLSGGVGSVAGSFAFTTPSDAPDAGTAAQGFTFTPTDSANYNSASGAVNVTVARANPTVTTAPTATSIIFGQTLASSTLSGGVGSVAGSFAFTTPSNVPQVGTAAQGFTFTPTDFANYNKVTGRVVVEVLPTPPTFLGYAVTTKIDKILPIFPAKILARAASPNGERVSLTRVFPGSAQGGSVSLTSTVNYTPPPGFTGADSFEVELTSSGGGVLRARIDVMVTVITTKFLSFTVVGGKPVVEFRGIPGRSYTVERSTDLSSWSAVGTVTAAADGTIRFTDNAPPAPSGYYRTQN